MKMKIGIIGSPTINRCISLNAIKACKWELDWIDGRQGRKHNPDPRQRINIKLNILTRYMVNSLVNKGLECKVLKKGVDLKGHTPMAEVSFQVPASQRKKVLDLIGGSTSYQFSNDARTFIETVGNIGARYIVEFTSN